ncbi:MAG: hypothetical protein ACRBCT_01030, partial [Alphaproteobacteria bacterium]
MKHIVLLAAFLSLLTSCAEIEKPAEQQSQLTLKPTTFSALPNWGSDTLKTFTAAFEKSCAKIAKIPGDRAFGPLKQAGTYKDWQKICFDFAAL